jgi:cardiolipin synthase (CMP-forming)
MRARALSGLPRRRYVMAMNSTTTNTARLRAHPFALPNILTYGRIAVIPIVVGCMFSQSFLHGGLWLRWVALAFFIAAAVSDFLDGYLARMWEQQSSLGRMLDPIADKLLVAASLMMLVGMHRLTAAALFPAIVIILREILVSGLREYLASVRVGMPVTYLAKWKTGFQMVAIGMLLAGRSGAGRIGLSWFPVAIAGETMLWIAAILTIVTGWDYLRAGIHHAIKP